jgi:quercetin dioxygenase-like cupin family protein
MESKAFVRTPEDRPAGLRIVGERITVLADARATGGYEVFLQEGPAGSGPPPHEHAWDEAFFVLDGEMEFGFGDERRTAVPGTLVHLPRGTVHWFRFGAGGARMLSMTGTGTRAAGFFTDLAAAVPDGGIDAAKFEEVAGRWGVRFA